MTFHRRFMVGFVIATILSTVAGARSSQPGHVPETAEHASGLAALLWRMPEREDAVCQGFRNQPLVDAITQAGGKQLVLLEGASDVCTRIINLA